MLSESDALAHILTRISPLPPRRVPLAEALHAFAHRAVHATVPLPGFDNSAMDGYAVKAEDTRTHSPLRVMAAISAGEAATDRLEKGCAIRIFTGAPMPEGADAVIMQEDVRLAGDGTQIVCNEPVERGENVRVVGCDLCVGQKIVGAGEKLTPARLATLAAQGLAETEVAEAPRIAILTTGDELTEPGSPLTRGMIYNSNATLLDGLVREHCPDARLTVRHVKDDLALTTEALRELTAAHDFVLLSGGVSVGEKDFVKPALEALGIPAEVWGGKVKPGKPLLFAQTPTEAHACHVFGLPGNPVSVFVTFQLFVRPALLKAMGADAAELALLEATAAAAGAMKNPGDRPHYLRGRYEHGRFTALGAQQSHALFGLSQANALMRMEPGQQIAAGEPITVRLCGR